MKRADIPAKTNIIQLVKENILASTTQRLENLTPYSYYTDGGTYNDDYYYFIQNLFSKTGVCHSTKTPNNANIQAYLGRKVIVDPATVNPKLYKPKNGEAGNIISIPYE